MTLGLNEICDNGNNINISYTGILDESKYEGVKKYRNFKETCYFLLIESNNDHI